MFVSKSVGISVGKSVLVILRMSVGMSLCTYTIIRDQIRWLTTSREDGCIDGGDSVFRSKFWFWGIIVRFAVRFF